MTRRTRSGLVVEVAALAVAVAVASALTGDVRATALNKAALWVGFVVAAIPPIRSIVRSGDAILTDLAAAFGLLCAIMGSYTIGGLALLGPMSLMLIAAVLHHVATPQGGRALGLESSRPQIVGGGLATAVGTLLGLSMTPLALVGLGLSAAGIGLLGSGFSAQRRRRSKRAAFGRIQAVTIVTVANVLAWVIAIGLVEIF